MRPERIRKEARKASRQIERKPEDDGFRRTPDGKIMCAVPLVPCSRIGQPIPTDATDGVKLQCTNSKCRYTEKLLHRECFKSLEQGLLTILANQGSARGWTEAQRRHNLWERKGLTLVQRSLRCACGKGQVKRDEDAWNARMAILEPEEKVKPCKKKNKKALPSLNFNKRTTPSVDMKKVHELDTHFLSSHSPPPMSAFEEHYGTTSTTAPPIRTLNTESLIPICTVKPTVPLKTAITSRKMSPIRPPAPAVVVTGISRMIAPEPASKINAVEKWQQFRTRSRTSSNSATPTSTRTSSSGTSISASVHSTGAPISTITAPIPEAVIEDDCISDAMSGEQCPSSKTSFKSARSTCSPLPAFTTPQSPLKSVSSGRAPTPPRSSDLSNVSPCLSLCETNVDGNTKETQTDLCLLSGETALRVQTVLDKIPMESSTTNDSGLNSTTTSSNGSVKGGEPAESLAEILDHLSTSRRHILTSSPPGFEAEYRRRQRHQAVSIDTTDEDGTSSCDDSQPLPFPPPRSKYYCLFDGPNIGLGERLVELLASGTYKEFRC